MVNLVVLINLFFIPVLPFYLIHKEKQKPLKLNFDLLCQYCIIVGCNIPITKIFTFLAKKVGRVFISIDSGYYTLAALVSAILIYMLYLHYRSERLLKCKAKLCQYCNKQYQYYRTYLREKHYTEKIKKKGAKQILRELAPAYLLVFAGCFMMLVFEPILMYTSNMNDFWFDFGIMIWPVPG